MLFQWLYRVNYYAGVQTVRLMHRMGRLFAFVLQPLFFMLKRSVGRVVGGIVRELRELSDNLKREFSKARLLVKGAWKRHPLLGVLQMLFLPVSALRKHPRIAKGCLRLTALVAAVVVLLMTVDHWQGITYAVALESDGDVWGYVSDESVLQDGTDMAAERLRGLGTLEDVGIKTALSLTMVHETNVLSTAEVCDLLLQKSDISMTVACGIYVDGVFQGAVPERRRAEEMLKSILKDSREGQPGVTSSFFQEVELIDGYYPSEAVLSLMDMKESLTSESVEKEFYVVEEGDTLLTIAKKTDMPLLNILRLNPKLGTSLTVGQTLLVRDSEPHLQVLITGIMEYEVEVPYTTKRVADASEYVGYERVRIQGKKGTGKVTVEATYLDGQELYSEIISTTVLEEPVTQVVAYGTKTIKNKTYKGGPYATGKFIWPLPYTTYITQYYGNQGHGGIDISDSKVRGKDIVAADGGTVVVAAYRKGTSYGSYGKYVLIDHGGGYQTLYAHCDELLVEPGDIVRQGQVIALVGNTGRSTGPHLHFEVQVNGKRVNPLSFF